MKRMLSFILSLVMLFAVFTGCDTVSGSSGRNISSKFSQYLDYINFVPSLTQADFISQLEQYRYNGTSITDFELGAYVDALWGGGYYADGDLFGFEEEYRVSEDEKYADCFTRLYTKVTLEGLTLPYEIEFGDTLSEVFEILGIGLDPYNEFSPDLFSDTKMTLYSDEKSTIILENLKLSKNPIDFEFPYVLSYVETYDMDNYYGKTTTVERRITFCFDFSEDAVLGRFEVSVNENRELG